MDRDLWMNLNEIETRVMQAHGVVYALMDSMTGPEHEMQINALWAVDHILRTAKEHVNKCFKGPHKEDEEPIEVTEEGTWYEEGDYSLFREGASAFVGDAVQDSEPQASKEGTAEDAGEFAGRFGVTMVKENADGSATFSIDASAKDMNRLFEVMFTNTIARGLDATKTETSDILNDIRMAKVIVAAKEIEEKLRKWEVEDEYDYLPEVQEARYKLTDALNEYTKGM